MMRNRASVPLAAAVVALVCCGCGSREFVTVSGTVTLDGEPLKDAFVTFLPEDGNETGRVGYGKTDFDGAYELAVSRNQEGIRPGTYRVEISTSDSALDERGIEYTLPELVPARYNKQTTLTDLTIESSGSQTFDFDLTSEDNATQERASR